MVKDKEDWHAAVHGVTKRWTRLSNQPATAKYNEPEKIRREVRTRRNMEARKIIKAKSKKGV